jgi:MFS family permease
MTWLMRAIAPPRLGNSFRWLLGSSWSTNLGDGIALAAAPLLIASQTRNPFLIAMAALLQRLPWLLFGLHAGVVADRLDRRKIVVAVNLIRAGVLAALSAAIVTDLVNVAVVLAAMFMLGTAEVFVDTTTSTLLPMVVGREDLGIANARLVMGFFTWNQLAGPALGATLFAASTVAPFGVQVGLVTIGAMLIARIGHEAVNVERSASGAWSEITDGIRWLWRHRAMRTLTITIVSFNVTFGAAWSVLVLYALDRLQLGEIGFGLLTSVMAVGGLLGSGIYGRLTTQVSLANIMRAGLIIETGTHLVLAVTTTPAVALAIIFVFGIHASAWATTSATIRQRAVPLEFQGRVGSVYMMGVQGGIVVGAAVGGTVADIWGITGPFWFAFAGSALILAVIWRELGNIAAQ